MHSWLHLQSDYQGYIALRYIIVTARKVFLYKFVSFESSDFILYWNILKVENEKNL